MNIVWDSNQKSWNIGYAHAKEYFESHGNLDFNTIYVCDDGYKLGQWKRAQLRQLSGGNVKPERVEKLKQIGLSAV